LSKFSNFRSNIFKVIDALQEDLMHIYFIDPHLDILRYLC